LGGKWGHETRLYLLLLRCCLPSHADETYLSLTRISWSLGNCP
jgi:hypothetical protein